MATISVSCSSYTGRYYNVDYVDGITEDEYSVYEGKKTAADRLVVLLTWCRDKSSHEKKERIKDYELTAYLGNKGIPATDINDIMSTLDSLPVGNGSIESFSYTRDGTKYHMHFFFQVVE